MENDSAVFKDRPDPTAVIHFFYQYEFFCDRLSINFYFFNDFDGCAAAGRMIQAAAGLNEPEDNADFSRMKDV
jgi:hypothetical protein